uniref:Uncharacterized protein n=1 Tax=Anguilla anguilla TaxID=7936 RepID=A0A0E9US67_ANGAN
MYQAVSRIVCGHPEGGGLKIKSLNWYEDTTTRPCSETTATAATRSPCLSTTTPPLRTATA